MKKLVTFLVILVMSLTAAMAQSAAKLNYQAVVRSSDNHLASNETVNVTIDIKVSGTSVFSETHNAVNTNINGLLNLIIGEGTAQTGDLATIDWAHATIEATITWGENTVTTSNPVYAVPLALSANVDCSTVVGCVDNAIANGSSTTNNAIDTVIVNHLTPYEIKNCDDVVACPIIQNMRDSIQSNYEEIEHLTTDLNTLETRVETFNTHVCDSVADCIHDSLVNYTIKNCADVMACPDIQNMRDSIQINHDEIEHLTTDLNTLETRVETFNTHVCDSIKDCVAAQISDSLNTNIRPNYYTKSETYNKTEVDALIPTVNNSTITFHQEGSTDQTITLNQSTNQTITIVTYSQKSKKFSATTAQDEFELGETPDTDNHLVQMYINGVYVGDTVDSVVKISGTKAQYQKGNNNNYDLVASDRVQFVYWVK
ncbi:MAG: hypothetical protein IKO89_02580 [Bacteroidales bacterium]|nr:hypothetical protein [Bacteroidales bacterium]